MKRILLVDDQAHVLRVIKLSLDRQGFEVDTALSGDMALAMMRPGAAKRAGRNGTYDVLITNADMPGMNGMQLCEAVRRDMLANFPLMFVVGEREDALATAWARDFVDAEILEKPMSLLGLVNRLDQHFDDHKLAAAIR